MLRAPVLSMRTVALFVGMLALLAATIALPGGATAQTTGKVAVPVSGTTSNGGAFKGKVVIPKITYRETTDSFRIAGTLVGKVTNPNGTQKAVNEDFATKLTLSQGGDSKQRRCEILDLDIGAIHLDLLGLVVNIAPIHINVTAVSGAGNLLGNLLCAVAVLLDQANVFDLATFLNILLAMLFTL